MSDRLRSLWVLVLGTIAVLCLSASGAVAQLAQDTQDATAPEASASTEQVVPDAAQVQSRHWYGWQTILADSSSVGFFVAGVAADSVGLGLLGFAGFTFATPVIHGAHDNHWWLGSMLLRLAVPTLIVGGAAIAFSDCPLFGDGHCNDAVNTLGAGVAGAGLVTAIAMPFVDAALAFETPAPARSSFAITPWLTPRADTIGLTVSGSM